MAPGDNGKAIGSSSPAVLSHPGDFSWMCQLLLLRALDHIPPIVPRTVGTPELTAQTPSQSGPVNRTSFETVKKPVPLTLSELSDIKQYSHTFLCVFTTSVLHLNTTSTRT